MGKPQADIDYGRFAFEEIASAIRTERASNTEAADIEVVQNEYVLHAGRQPIEQHARCRYRHPFCTNQRDVDTKLIPNNNVIEEHARRIIKERLIEQAMAKISDELAAQSAAAELPQNLREEIGSLLSEERELPWDAAVARIVIVTGAIGDVD